MGYDFSLPGLGKPESSRPKRVAEAIRNELSILLLQKVRDARLRQVSITRVDMAPDLKRAKVYFSVAAGGHAGQAAKGLERARGFFRSSLARVMNLRYTPDLVFFQDRHIEENERLEQLFAELARERKPDADPE